jgi:membrane protease YdiL (CAAX protease family)
MTSSSQAALDPVSAWKILGATMVGWLVTALLVAAVHAQTAVALISCEGALIAIPLWRIRARRLPLATLGLRRPAGRFWVAVVMLGGSLWSVNLALVELVQPHGDSRALEQVAIGPPLGLSILTLGVLAPLGEELVFRGVLARSLATRVPAATAVAISAVTFSAFHMSAIQALPTLVLGLALAFVAVRADSILPSIAMHALNNTIALLLARGDLPWLAESIGDRGPWVLLGAVIATALGLAIAWRPA